MSDYTKHLSFLFIVPNEFFSSMVKVKIPYEINVRYTLNYKGEVALDDYNVKPGMAQHIVNWTGLEEQMFEAAKNNSKSHQIPGTKRGNSIRPEGLKPYDDIHDQWRHEIHEKEHSNW